MRIGCATACAALLSLSSPSAAQLPVRWPRAPLTDVARAQVHADVALDRYGLTGRGSTLCLVDTGIDEALDPERVRWVWEPDGASRGDPLEAELGGAVFGPGEANGSRGDAHGHGTAMASIAAGAEGMAPGARLVVAAAWDADAGGFPDEVVVRAIRFCRAVAARDDAIDEAQMVILLSLGGHDGEHDGQGAFERAIVREAGPIPVVVAAGNDGERAVHAAGRLFRGERARVEVQVPRAVIDGAALGLTVRLEPSERRAILVAPNGQRALLEPGSFEHAGAQVDVAPRDDAFAVTLAAGPTGLPSGTWALEVEGSARFDVWLAGARLGSTFLPPSLGGDHVLDAEVITIPATAPELIAVGASIARPTVGDLASLGEAASPASFASRGPTSAGFPKPDVIAPGGWILARLSSDVRPDDPENLVGGRMDPLIDGRVAVRGTSASAAVVAGALLLALELDPSRGPIARALLVSSTRESGWTPERGFGALDVERLLARWSGAPIEHRELVTPRAMHQLGDVLWLTARGDGARLHVAFQGQSYEAPLEGGVAWLAVDPGPVAIGVLHIEATLDGRALPPLELAAWPDRRRPLTVAGGCHAAAGSSRPSPFGLFLLAIGIFFRRRPRGGTTGA